MSDELYTAKGLQVWKSPVTKDVEGGKSIAIGFHVCTATEVVGEEGASAIAALLSIGETTQKQGAYREGQARALKEALQVADEEAELWGHEDGSSARVVATRIKRLLDELSMSAAETDQTEKNTAHSEVPAPQEHVNRLERVERNVGYLLELMSSKSKDRHKLTYKNYRGEISERDLHLVRFWFGSTEWHPHPQLLLRAFDFEKDDYRDFAVGDFILDDGVADRSRENSEQ